MSGLQTRRRTQSSGRKLDADAWIQAALDALAEDGLSAVAVEPLARRMDELELAPADLVKASEDQLTHKMVRRAMKGRRLTANTMDKVCRAWNRATRRADACADLFDYEP